MPYQQPQEDSLEIAEKVRTGEYFREAQNMYDFSVHDPMAERYLYLFITFLSLLAFLIAYIGASGLYPLQTAVPFIYSTNDIVDDLPRIRSLLKYKGENPSEALLRFLAGNYVTLREQYDIESFDRSVSGVKSQSSPVVYKEYQQSIDPRNPESPISLYQRHSQRKINVVEVKRVRGQPDMAEVVFEATVESRSDIKKSRWQADIAFNYNGIKLDQKEEKVEPIVFIVTQYRSKRLQDIK